MLIMLDNTDWASPSPFWSYKNLKLKLKVFLTGNAVAMVTSDVKK